MGGFGSGMTLRSSTRTTVEDYRSIDIRKWKREGWLKGHKHFTTTWSVDGEKKASINVESLPDRVILTYRSRTNGGEWEDIRTEIELDFTPCHFGGRRVWFLCPWCCRRVAKLYGGKYFWCRECHKLPYRSQGESDLDRAMRRANHYFDQICDGDRLWLVKPKGMHWKTYWRLYDKGMAEMRKVRLHAARNWGQWGTDMVEDCVPITPYELPH